MSEVLEKPEEKPIVIGTTGKWLFIRCRPYNKIDTKERKALLLEMSKLWKEGLSMREIAKTLNVSFGVAKHMIGTSGTCLNRDPELFPNKK